MGIRLNCRCGRSLHLRDDLAGLAIRCPQCRKILQVPDGWLQGTEADEGVAAPATQGRSRRAASGTAGFASSLGRIFCGTGHQFGVFIGVLLCRGCCKESLRGRFETSGTDSYRPRRWSQSTGSTARLPVQSPQFRPDYNRGRSRYLDFQNWAVRSCVFPAGS